MPDARVTELGIAGAVLTLLRDEKRQTPATIRQANQCGASGGCCTWRRQFVRIVEDQSIRLYSKRNCFLGDWGWRRACDHVSLNHLPASRPQLRILNVGLNIYISDIYLGYIPERRHPFGTILKIVLARLGYLYWRTDDKWHTLLSTKVRRARSASSSDVRTAKEASTVPARRLYLLQI